MEGCPASFVATNEFATPIWSQCGGNIVLSFSTDVRAQRLAEDAEWGLWAILNSHVSLVSCVRCEKKLIGFLKFRARISSAASARLQRNESAFRSWICSRKEYCVYWNHRLEFAIMLFIPFQIYLFKYLTSLERMQCSLIYHRCTLLLLRCVSAYTTNQPAPSERTRNVNSVTPVISSSPNAQSSLVTGRQWHFLCCNESESGDGRDRVLLCNREGNTIRNGM